MEKTEEINKAIINFGADAIKLSTIMQDNQSMKQAMFSVSICEEDNCARIAPVICGDMRVLTAVLTQIALQDDWVKELIIATKKGIDEGIKLPVMKKSISDI